MAKRFDLEKKNSANEEKKHILKTERLVFGFKCVFIFLICAVLVLPLMQFIVKAQNPDPKDYDVGIIDTGWVSETGKPVQLGRSYHMAVTSKLVAINTLPQEFDNESYCICFESFYQTFKVYVDGRLVHEYNASGKGFFERAPGKCINIFDLPENSGGKTIRIEFISPYHMFVGVFAPVYYGSQLDVSKYIRTDSLTQFSFATGMLFLSLFGLIAAVLMSFLKRRNIESIFSIMFTMMIISVYLLTDTTMFKFWMDDDSLSSTLTLCANLFLPLAIIVLSFNVFKSYLGITKDAIAIVSIGIYIIVLLLLDLFDVVGMPYFHFSTKVLILLSSFYTGIRLIVNKKVFFGTVTVITGLCLFIYGIFYIDISVIIVALQLLLAADTLIKEIVYYVRQEAGIKANDFRLNRSRNEVLVNQINSHFFYHTLDAIRGLIKTDPDGAYVSIAHLARYLRYNTDSINAKDGLVMLSDELRSVKTYVELVKCDNNIKIDVIYNTDYVDFLVPVLSVQPLVENAIKHGLTPKGGGTVTISAYISDGRKYVSVEDNGVGMADINKMSDRSIAVNNIKQRIMFVEDADFSVESAVGVFTRVIMSFPEEEKKANENNSGG